MGGARLSGREESNLKIKNHNLKRLYLKALFFVMPLALATGPESRGVFI
jgi:hypothetical protein